MVACGGWIHEKPPGHEKQESGENSKDVVYSHEALPDPVISALSRELEFR
jgi:hypothetical protein